MAIALDAVTTASNPASDTFSHTVGAGSDRALLVWLHIRDFDSPAPTVTGVTYDGVSMTQVARAEVDVDVNRFVIVECWKLANPSTGANNVVVSIDEGIHDLLGVAVSYTGVDQTSVAGASNTATGESASPSVSVTTTAADSVVLAGVASHGPDSRPFSPGSGVTERWDEETGTHGNNDIGGFGGEKDAATAGSYTVDATVTDTSFWSAVGVEVLAAGGASAVTVNASPGVVAVSGPTATVTAPVAVAAAAGVVAVSGIQASITAPVVVGASSATVSVVGVQASVSSPVVVQASPATVAVSAPAASITAPIVVSAGAGVVSVTGVQASVSVEVPIALEETVTGSVDGGTSLSLTSWTPQADELVLLAVAVRDESVTITPSGNGLTWVEVADVDNVQGQCGIAVYRAMGSSPSSGQISVSLSSSTVAVAIASRFSGVDTSGTNGSGAVEGFATNSGPATDNDDMVVEVTTSTAEAWAWAAGTHRLQSFTVPGDETGISVNQAEGSGGDTTSLSTWYKEMGSPGTEELGAAADLSGDSDWATIGVSIAPAFVGPVTVQASVASLTVSGPAATVDASTTVSAATAVVQVVGITAAIGNIVSVQASPGVVQVVGQQATIVAPIVVAAAPGVVTVVGVGATVAISADVTVAAGVGVVQVVGVPAVVDTPRILLDPEVSDAPAYVVEVADAVVYAVELSDSAPYEVELEDASRS